MKKLLFLYILIVPTIAQSVMVDKIIAKVGSDVITMSDVSHAINEQRNFLIQKYGKAKGIAEFQKFKKNILEELILQKILKDQKPLMNTV